MRAVTVVLLLLPLAGCAVEPPAAAGREHEPDHGCRAVDAPDIGRDRVAVAAHAGAIYVFGGRVANGAAVSDILRVDPATGAAETVGHLTEARMGIAVAEHDGTFYLFGGLTEIFPGRGGGRATSTVERWTPGEPAAERLDTLLSPHRGHALAVSDGQKIHLIGGDTGEANLDDILVFDPATQRITPAGVALPTPRSLVAGAWSGASVYLAGGRGNDASDSALLWRYTPVLRQLVEEPARLPAPLHGASSLWDGDALLVHGGHEQTRSFGDVGTTDRATRYDPGEPPSPAPDLPEPRSYHGAVMLDERAYLVGGSHENGIARTMLACA